MGERKEWASRERRRSSTCWSSWDGLAAGVGCCKLLTGTTGGWDETEGGPPLRLLLPPPSPPDLAVKCAPCELSVSISRGCSAVGNKSSGGVFPAMKAFSRASADSARHSELPGDIELDAELSSRLHPVQLPTLRDAP